MIFRRAFLSFFEQVPPTPTHTHHGQAIAISLEDNNVTHMPLAISCRISLYSKILVYV